MSVSVLDSFARRITYLRVSVTDRCDFRCVYCNVSLDTLYPEKFASITAAEGSIGFLRVSARPSVQGSRSSSTR